MKRLSMTFFVALSIFACKSVPSNLELNKDLSVSYFCTEREKIWSSGCFQNYLNNYIKNNFNGEFQGEREESLVIRFNIDENGYIHSISARPEYKNWNIPHPSSLIEAERILKVLSKEIRINFAVFSNKELKQYLKGLSDESLINLTLAPFNGGYEIPLTLNFSMEDGFINCERSAPPPPPDPPIEKNSLKDSQKAFELDQVDIYFGDNFHEGVLDTYPVSFGTFECSDIPKRPYTEFTRECFNEFIKTYVQSEINLELIENSGLKGTHSIMIDFFIDKNGKVGDVVCAREQIPILSNELIRVIKSLPDFSKPGTIHYRNVGARFFQAFKIDLSD